MSHKIIFLGSGEFAVPSLRALAGADGRQGADFEIELVITQPDQPAGRGQKMQVGVLAAAARELGLKVAHPESAEDLREVSREAVARGGRPEALVVVSYGKILPQDILDLSMKGCLNLHPSLLPLYRGPAPIEGPILAGDEETGVSVMLLDAKMDHGPILAQKRVKIEAEETGETLSRKLAEKGARELVEALGGWLAGKIEPREQNHSQATYMAKITKEMGRIDWSRPAAEIERRIRAFQPWPGAFTFWEGKMLKISRARVGDLESGSSDSSNLGDLGDLTNKKNSAMSMSGEAGVVVSHTGRDLGVVCGQGILEISELQLEGRKAMGARDFLAGNGRIVGARLG